MYNDFMKMCRRNRLLDCVDVQHEAGSDLNLKKVHYFKLARFGKMSEMSDTYVPDLRSDMTEGRMQMGGTGIRVRMRCAGSVTDGFISSSEMSCSGMASRSRNTS